MLENTYLYERRFEILFNDTIRYANLANAAYKKEDYDELESFSRASVFTSTLIFECAANCCLDILNLSKTFNNDIDKLPFLSKYEYFYNTLNKETKIDRGCQEFRNAAELKSIRDLIVHPKVKRTKWKRVSDNSLQADFGQTTLLKIPYSIEEWNLTDVQSTLRVVCAFLDYFFRVACNFTPNKVGDILLSFEDYTSGMHIANYSVPNSWRDAQKEWSLRLEFLGIDCPETKNI